MHLDLHKARSNLSCGNEGTSAFGVNAFRVAPLLARGAVVLSERSDPRDEADYKSLIKFGAVADLPGMYQRLPTRGKLTAERRRVQLRFRKLFNPSVLFAQAGMPELMLSLRKNRSRCLSA